MAANDTKDRDRLIDAYFAHANAGRDDGLHVWAVEAVWKIGNEDPEGTWILILEMLRRAEGDYMIAYIAAGPLEDLIVAHGPRFIDRIEAEARDNPKCRRALVGVWGRNRMSEDVDLRLRALTEGEPPL